MPRGQRKSLEEKIQAKQELINALNIRIESEERELEELLHGYTHLYRTSSE